MSEPIKVVATTISMGGAPQIARLDAEQAYRDLYQKSLLDSDEYDPDECAAYINEIMAEDDVDDPLLESYQQLATPSFSVSVFAEKS